MFDSIFREYDIRGIYQKDLNEQSVKAIGICLGNVMKSRGVKSVSVGYDARVDLMRLGLRFMILGCCLHRLGILVFLRINLMLM